MIVLGLDTSSPAVTVAVVEVGAGSPRVLASSAVVDARRHGELLASGIQAVLREAEITRREIGAVVAGVGPGPYTGLRVGIVTAAALADALAIPSYGVCSLDSLAADVGGGEGLVVMADARRREVYWAEYDGARQRIAGPAVDRPTEVLVATTARRVVGAGAHLYATELAGREVLGEPVYPSAATRVTLAVARVLEHAPTEVLVPLYLRRPDAQVPAAGRPVTQP